ncbi:MAG: hypothetical protein U0235_10260 [Polyangiaceae bacterium]
MAELRRPTCHILLGLAGLSCNGSVVVSAPPGDAGASSVAPDAAAATGPRVLVSGLAAPLVLATDTSTLFFVSGDGRLSSIPLDGGDVRTLVTSDVAPIIAVDDVNVYVVLQQDGQLVAIPKDGGARARLSGPGRVSAVTTRAGAVFWAEAVDSTFILRSSRSATPLATFHGCCPGQLAATKTTVFACAFAPLAAPIAGGSFTEFDGLRCQWLRADDTAVFTESMNTLVQIDSDGRVSELFKGLGSTTAALDSSGLYVAASAKIQKVQSDGGAPIVVASEAVGVSSLALSERGIFFAAMGTIRRVDK